MVERRRSRTWAAIAVVLFAIGVLVGLGMLLPSIVLAAGYGREFALSDALMPLLALALFALASITALKVGPRLTAKPGAPQADAPG